MVIYVLYIFAGPVHGWMDGWMDGWINKGWVDIFGRILEGCYDSSSFHLPCEMFSVEPVVIPVGIAL